MSAINKQLQYLAIATGLSLLGGVALADEARAIPSSLLGLEQAIREAHEKSPTLQRAKAATDESQWGKFEALGAGFLPKVSANANHYFNSKYEVLDVTLGNTPISFPQIYPATTLGLNIMIPVFDGLANVEHYQAAALFQSASEQELSHTEFQLEQDVRLAFFQALAAQQLEDVAEQNERTLEDHLKEIEALKKGGAATNYDVLRVQVQLTEAKSDAVDAHDNTAIAKRKLTQILGLEQDTRRLEGALPPPDAKRVETVQFEEVPASRTDLTALRQRVDAVDKEHTAQSLWFVPRVLAGAEYDFYNNHDTTINNSEQFRSAYSVGLFLQWNIFDGGVSLARSKEAGARQVQAAKTSEEAVLQVPYDFDLWKRRYLSSSSRYDAKRLDVKRSEESVRLARLEARAGSRTSTEVLDAELDLFRSRAGVVTSQMNSLEALIKLENTLGRRI